MKTDYLKNEGNFEAVAFKPDSGWLAKSKEKGTPSIRIGLRVVNDVADDGKIIFWDGWLSDKAMPVTMRALVEAFNFDGDLSSLVNGGFTFEDLPCAFYAESEEYDGKSRIKVKWLNPRDGWAVKELPEEDAKAIVALFGSKTRMAAVEAKAEMNNPVKETARPKSTPAKAVAVPDGEDDVPF